MIDLSFGRHALGVCLAVAMLAGCGGTQPPIDGSFGNTSKTVRSHEIFRYTGNEQKFKVPAQVTKITVVALGASGSRASSTGYKVDGPGGEVTATIPVTPHETLYLFVGGQGGLRFAIDGGYNGGGNGGGGGSNYLPGFGGDGASDIRQGGDALNDRIIVAGGGGGAAVYGGGSGGAGGGKIGQSGASSGSGQYTSGGGGGGTQKSGGAGGPGPSGSCPGGAGESGTFGQGGNGGESGNCYYHAEGGGGGGGGYYGGGGGGGEGGCYGTCGNFRYGSGGGGGGGSSYVERPATHVKNLQGAAPVGNGKVTIYWVSR
jgi:hypothetical protein